MQFDCKMVSSNKKGSRTTSFKEMEKILKSSKVTVEVSKIPAKPRNSTKDVEENIEVIDLDSKTIPASNSDVKQKVIINKRRHRKVSPTRTSILQRIKTAINTFWKKCWLLVAIILCLPIAYLFFSEGVSSSNKTQCFGVLTNFWNIKEPSIGKLK